MFEEIIAEVRQATVVQQLEIDGKKFTDRAIYRVPQTRAKAIEVNTLLGVVDWMKASDLKRDSLIHVTSPVDVSIFSLLDEDERDREHYVHAKATAVIGASFQFGQFYDSEEFIIRLLTLFLDTPERAQILQIVGTIDEEAVKTTADDGITQTVIARVGITRKQEVTVKNLVALKPFRTFREVEQPESLFLIRMRGGREGQKPTVALFEADGGAWKLDAIANIKGYLSEKLPEATIIG